MGGNAFAARGIETPRMSSATYCTLRLHFLKLLATIFQSVDTPKEAPEKTSHGDIDIFVYSLRQPAASDIPKLLSSTLSSTAMIAHNHHHPSLAVDYHSCGLDTEPGKTFVQIDITVCQSEAQYKWGLVRNSYGDIFHILGVALRPYSLTFKPDGLIARLPEIWPFDKKKSEIWLTQDPDAVLDLLGLDRAVYEQDFQTQFEAFDWITSGRYFDRRPFEWQTSEDEEHIRMHGSNDRRRMKNRAMLINFVHNYLPLHPDKGAAQLFDQTEPLRSTLTRFGKQEVASEKIRVFKADRLEEDFWNRAETMLDDRLVGAVERDDKRHEKARLGVRAVKRWVEPNDTSWTVRETPQLGPENMTRWTETAHTEEALLEIVRSALEVASLRENRRVSEAKRERRVVR